MSAETVYREVLLEKLRQHNGGEVHVIGGTANFGLSVQGHLRVEADRFYIDKKIDGQEKRYAMDITDYVKRCDILDVRPVNGL